MKLYTKFYIPALCLLLTMASGCRSLKSSKTENTDHKVEKVNGKETFDSFYNVFIADKKFQLSRVKFPLEGEIYMQDKKVKPILESDWSPMQVHISKVDRTEYKVEIKQTDSEVVHRIYIPSSSVDITTRYKLIDKKWYLIYMKNIFM